MGEVPAIAWLIGGGAFLTVLLIGLAFGDESDRDLKRRVTRVGAGAAAARRAGGGKAALSLRIDQQDSANPLLDRLIKTLVPNPQRIRERLARTGRRIPLGEYLLVNALVAGVAWVVLGLVVGLPMPLPLAGAVILGVGVPHMAVKVMGDRRVAQFVAQFPDAIDLICRGLRSGLPVTESINAVGREVPDPLGAEFRKVGDAVRVGQSLDGALWEVATRIDTPEFRFLIIAMAIQRETGGNLAETLGNLSDLLRKRRQMKLKIKALSSEARASAYIIGSLPFLMFFAISAVNPGYTTVFFEDPRAMIMGGIALGMIAVGAFVMYKMVNFDA
ncbi:MAG TPA: type II secretion system F family protein [Azospirillum sp.]|nr:type II secretion system F family protein [Azospirillum sp.]